MASQFFPTVVKFSPLSAVISETSISKILSRQRVALLAYQLNGLGVRVSATNPRRLRGLKEGAVHTTRPFFLSIFYQIFIEFCEVDDKQNCVIKCMTEKQFSSILLHAYVCGVFARRDLLS